ncbi:hypothetical protein SAMN05216337_102065 [Bradyrhizobium brasilense]|uniref:Uncharacterized protein n=1 Tax=Bradyrhizobium brasilense TaxID=1419277 RepID=A0A1G7AC39_9BRAD|nr:hypothetical protein [Bradyrhizobium brasilense]SDE12382.1 hypothetical protein SAMN05216337_102065 [Bradyrhizobium brasilense]
MAFPSYSTGTVSVNAGDTTIVGVGTIWSGINVRAGDDIVIAGHTVIVEDVTDTTHIVVDAWPYANVPAGTAYKVVQRSPLRFAGGQAMAAVNELVEAMNADGFYFFVAPTLTAPDPSYGNDGQYGFQASTGKLWVKTGGAWSFLGIYKGFGFKGNYDSGVTYSVNDVVSSAGSAYIYGNGTPSAGNAPPNPAYWTLLAGKGDQGNTGPAPWSVPTTWASGQNYVAGPPANIVRHPVTLNVYQCLVSHTSGADFNTDLFAGKWLVVVQGNAEGTSATSLAIGTGAKVFTTQLGLSYQNGVRLRASSAANALNWMEGVCTYDPNAGTLTMTVDKTGGAGTVADWLFNHTGQPGAGDVSSTLDNVLTGNNTFTKAPSFGDAGQTLVNLGLPQFAKSSLIEKFRGGTQSAELFTLANGINEFDLLKVGGVYYFAYDDRSTSQLVYATSIAGLATATPYNPAPGLRYPTIYWDAPNATWHLWGWTGSGYAVHCTSPSWNGTFTIQDALPLGFSDISVRKHSNGRYYATYKHNTELKAGIMVSNSLSGPWLNLGYCFSDLTASPVRRTEEADPMMFEADGKTYLLFSAYDGDQQRPSITEIDPSTGKALHQAVVLVNPLLPWQQRNGSKKLFNPVFLREDAAPDRIYFAHNPSGAGVATGWGYLEVGAAPADNRRDGDLSRTNFQATNMDVATGIPPVVHGSAVVNTTGLVMSSSTGGAYGDLNQSDINDFTVLVEFTPTALPANGTFSMLTRVSTQNADAKPIIGLWIDGTSSKLYCEIREADDVGSIATDWTTSLTAGTRYCAVLTRKGTAVTGYLNSHVDLSATFSGVLTGLLEWSAGNKKGISQAAAQQFNGTIHRVLVIPGALQVGDA